MVRSLFRCTRVLLALASTVATFTGARPAFAQQATRGRFGIGLVAGPVQFDMSGTGTTAFGALRADQELTSWLVLEQSLGVLRPDEQTQSRRTYVMPELQLQTQATFGRVRPYLGLGVGVLHSVSGGSRNYAVASGSVGARTAVAPTLDLRTELRVTAQAATLAQWTLGLARRF
ncbi:MAG: hypothetical protein JWN79_1229 [Gemmatimonadetes bacterium]|jgi:hypothetical protein|nr:hypothetical protein [Gemmatimonadota bacterium]